MVNNETYCDNCNVELAEFIYDVYDNETDEYCDTKCLCSECKQELDEEQNLVLVEVL